MLATEQAGTYEHELTTEPGIIRKGYGDVDAAFQRPTPLFRLSFPSAAIPACRWRREGAIARCDCSARPPP